MRTSPLAWLFGISLLCTATVAPYIAVAQSPVSDFFGTLSTGAGGFNPTGDPMTSPAVRQGIRLLAQLMEQNGYDRQRAWIAFVQSPEGQRAISVPGAVSAITDWLNTVMALRAGANIETQPQSGAQPPTNRIANQTDSHAEGEGRLAAPFLGPYRSNTYGPGINSDATGRPFVWQTDQGTTDPHGKVRPDVFGSGIGMDQYGRPVRATCPPTLPQC
jgi:hypothetical protein